ncbi:MAG: CsbD family protein [Candidatus Dechloromonas phosphoritropha]
MNKDQVKGAAKDLGGKIQEEVGKLTGNKSQQAEGLKNQVKGKIQEQVGDLKEAIEEVKKGWSLSNKP